MNAHHCLWLTQLLPHGTAYFFLIRINNGKWEINVCNFSMATSGFIGLTLWVFCPLFRHCDWSDLSTIPCSCGFSCIVHHCIQVAGQQKGFLSLFWPPLQKRTKVRLLCAGSRRAVYRFADPDACRPCCVEAELVCVTAQPVLLERCGCSCWPHRAVLRIKHGATLSWTAVAPLTLLGKQGRGGGRDLRDAYWSRFTSWRETLNKWSDLL